MYYHKSINPQGVYSDEHATRYDVSEFEHPERDLRRMCQEFPSLDACLAAWHLTYDPLPEPQPQPEK